MRLLSVCQHASIHDRSVSKLGKARNHTQRSRGRSGLGMFSTHKAVVPRHIASRTESCRNSPQNRPLGEVSQVVSCVLAGSDQNQQLSPRLCARHLGSKKGFARSGRSGVGGYWQWEGECKGICRQCVGKAGKKPPARPTTTKESPVRLIRTAAFHEAVQRLRSRSASAIRCPAPLSPARGRGGWVSTIAAVKHFQICRLTTACDEEAH